MRAITDEYIGDGQHDRFINTARSHRCVSCGGNDFKTEAFHVWPDDDFSLYHKYAFTVGAKITCNLCQNQVGAVFGVDRRVNG